MIDSFRGELRDHPVQKICRGVQKQWNPYHRSFNPLCTYISIVLAGNRNGSTKSRAVLDIVAADLLSVSGGCDCDLHINYYEHK